MQRLCRSRFQKLLECSVGFQHLVFTTQGTLPYNGVGEFSVNECPIGGVVLFHKVYHMGAAVQHGILQVESRLGICRNLCRSVQRFVGDLGQCGIEGLERLGQFRVVAVEAFSVAAVGGAGIVKCEAVVDVYGLVIERT